MPTSRGSVLIVDEKVRQTFRRLGDGEAVSYEDASEAVAALKTKVDAITDAWAKNFLETMRNWDPLNPFKTRS